MTAQPSRSPVATAPLTSSTATPVVRGAGERPAPGTLTQLFFDATRFDKPDALMYKAGGEWRPISHRDVLTRVRRIALGLQKLGVQRGDRVGILSENRPEWALADFACLTCGLTDVPLYPNLPPDQVAYILRDSGAVAVMVSNAEQATKIVEIRAQVPSLKSVITFAATREGADFTLAEVEAKGAEGESPESERRWREIADAVKPADLATLIYTSGTTGDPKGVMLTHDNLFSNVAAARTVIPFTGADVALSFLPLSHIFERMAGHYLMFGTGTTIAYAESIDTIAANLGEVRPTLCASVPRIYEKLYARVLENALSGSGVKKQIFFWARGVANTWADEKLAGREPGGLLAFKYKIAQKLVFSKLKARVGGRMRYFVSGGAPLSPEINKFFYAAGLVILEGYGLTETSPVIAVNSPDHFRIGTVGRPLPGVEVTIAGDGEILTRGPHVMQGYFNKPDATREALGADGWFRTGDIGTLRDGYLSITDRKKDIIVTAGGKNIAPQPIENRVKTNKYVSQAVMIGDKRKFAVMLVVPNMEQLEKWAKFKGLLYTSHTELLKLPLVQAKMEKAVFGQLEGLARFEMPKKIALVERDFTIESGELTPSLKVKRRVVDANHKAQIDALFADDGVDHSHDG